MRHEVGVRWADGSQETRHIGLIVYGDTHGHSAMAKTVGFPTGIAAKMVLEGRLHLRDKGRNVPIEGDMLSHQQVTSAISCTDFILSVWEIYPIALLVSPVSFDIQVVNFNADF